MLKLRLEALEKEVHMRNVARVLLYAVDVDWRVTFINVVRCATLQLEEHEKHVNKVRKRLMKESAYWFSAGVTVTE